MTITLHTWSTSDKSALMSMCNAVDRTFLSDRLPYPYTEVDADWWLGMVAENDGKEGIWLSERQLLLKQCIPSYCQSIGKKQQLVS